MKNIYLFSSLYETVPQFTAHSHAEVAKFCAQQRNQLKIAEYRRTGDKRFKKGLVYTILSEFKEGKPQQRASSNLEYTTHLQYDIDYLHGKTPEAMAEHIVGKLDNVDPRLKDHIYIEHSPTKGRIHCILLRIGDGTVRQEMLRYSKFFGIDADLCVNDTARFMSVTLESLCGTTLDNVLRDVPADLLTNLHTALGALPAPAAAASSPARPIVAAAKSASANPELIELVRDHLLNAMGGIPQKGSRNLFCYKFAAEMYSLAGNAPETIVGLLQPFSFFGLSREECERTVKSALHKKEQDGSYERSQLLRDSLDAAMRCHGIPPVILSQAQHEILSPQSSVDLSEETEPVVAEVAVEPTAVVETPVVEPVVEPAVAVVAEAVAEATFDPFSETPPEIEYSQLPGFLKVLLKGMPMKVVPHCINMLEPCAATYLLDSYTTDLVGQRLWLGSGWLNFSIAPQSSGKGSKNIPMAALKKKLLEDDLASRTEQQEWLKIAKTCKSSDLPPRPPHKTHLLASDTTSSALLQKLTQCAEGALFCEVDELSMLKNLSSNSDPTVPLLLCFNRERISVDRSSSEGEVGSVEMRLNVAATGTPHTANQYFKNCWHNGLISRCSFSTIVSESDDTFDDDFEYKSNIDEEKLAMYIQRLEDSANLELKCPQANKFAKRMRRMLQEIGAQYDSEPLKLLARRQCIILQKQCFLYYVLEGQKWSKRLEAFLLWRFHYSIWALWRCASHIVEQEYKQELSATAKQKQNGPCNWLAFLPETFGISELTQLRSLKGASTDSKLLTKQLSNWRSRGLIKNSDTPGKYINLKFKKP